MSAPAAAVEAKKGGKEPRKKETGLALQHTKAGNFSAWYTDVIVQAELVDYYDVSGCFILRPWSFKMWELVQGFLDARIKESGVSNVYFPMFVKRSALEAEADHVEGFAPEVAWVTESGSSKLAEPIAIRPTSETIMYPSYARWIRSHRDLPLRLNQWTNVVRWEFKCATPFIRTREFLWQEGHSAFATREEADNEVLEILDYYARAYEEMMAVPVIKGRKTEKEKFAGGLYTTTVEAFVPSCGRAIQAATSHCLGQNFARMFKISFEDDRGERSLVWQNSWGFTTRSLGICVMIHGDDKGLVLPPPVAPVQVVLVWVYRSKDSRETVEQLIATVDKCHAALRALGIRAEVDRRENYSAGWKYNYWEQKGVPLRVEVGPQELAAGNVTGVRRATGERVALPVEGFGAAVQTLLRTIHTDMLEKARKERDEHIALVTTWDEFLPALNGNNMCLVPFCDNVPCEERIKELTKASQDEEKVEEADDPDGEGLQKALSGAAKSLCIPMNQAPMAAGTKCIVPGCTHDAVHWTLFGRSY